MHFIQESEDWGQRDFSSSLSRAEAMECKTQAVPLFCEDSQSEISENEADKRRIRERETRALDCRDAVYAGDCWFPQHF